MCGDIYFSEPNQDIRITHLAKYLQDMEMEAMTYLWSKAANGEIIHSFLDSIFPFPPEKYMY